MTDLEQSALAVYFANCQGIKCDPLPMLRKILALGEGDRKRLDWLLARVSVDRHGVGLPCGRAKAAPADESRAAIDAAIAALRGEGAK